MAAPRKLVNIMTSVDSVKSGRAWDCFQAVQSLQKLLADGSKLQAASKLGASTASLDALTKFSSWELNFGEFFGRFAFNTPFHAGRRAAFYQELWALLAQLAPEDQQAEKAISAKRSVDALSGFGERSGEDPQTSAVLQQLRTAMSSARPSLLKAMKDELAVDALRKVMAFGKLEHVKVAEEILSLFEDVSEDAFRLASYRFFLAEFAKGTRFGPEDLDCIRSLLERALPQPEPNDFFSAFFGGPAVRTSPTLEGHIIRRFGLEKVGHQLLQSDAGGERHKLGLEIVKTFAEERVPERPSKRLRNA